MKKQEWKYKITSGLAGVVMSFVLLVVFGGLAYWFHISRNDAILIGRILVIFAVLAFGLALYRAIFFKVLMDENGFYFQTAPFNGKYYPYFEIKRMWVSTARETNAQETSYCNFETKEGKVFRFFFTGADWQEVNWLVKQVEKAETVEVGMFADDGRDYVISGKVQGLQRIAVVAFIFGIVIVLTVSLIKEGFPPYASLPVLILMPLSMGWIVMNYMFYKIQIQKKGFYCRTNPFNGKFHTYQEVTNCKLVLEKRKYGSAFREGVRETRYFYFLVFTDGNKKRHRIWYNKALFEREMKILVSRIEQVQEL